MAIINKQGCSDMKLIKQEYPVYTPNKDKEESKFSLTPLSTVWKIAFSPLMTTLTKGNKHTNDNQGFL